jgi:hypothetical protein
MSHPRYPFSNGDYLSLRPSYTYCDCAGDDFPSAWRTERRNAILQLAADAGRPSPPPVAIAVPTDAIAIDTLLDRIAAQVSGGDQELDRLVQRFEVGKRLYDVYRGSDRRGDTSSGFRDMARYVRFGELLAAAYGRCHVLPFLNALLKLCDLLCAHVDDIPSQWRPRATQVLIQEGQAVAALARHRGLSWPS